MKFLKFAALSATLLAGGCATEMAWQRADGRPLDSRFAWTAAHCRERARDTYGSRREAMERCMRHHGYVWTYSSAQSGYYDDYDD